MADLTAQEKLERARNSISVAEERLSFIKQRLPELNRELDELLVTNEIQGYKGRTIERTQSEINTLQKEKDTLEKTIEALKKKLPDIEKNTRLEIAETETVSEYKESLTVLKGLIEASPSDEELKETINKIQQYAEKLRETQQRFFRLSQTLNEAIVNENVESINDISIESLRDNLGSLNYQGILEFSDNLIDYADMVNTIQFELFKIGTAILTITDPLPPHIKETCKCERHKREFKPDSVWHMSEYRQDPIYLDVWGWEIIHREGGFKDKPEFPCEIKIFSAPRKPKIIQTDKEKDTDIPGKMVYGLEEDGIKDPDNKSVILHERI